jgi:hypothetical protein
MLVSPQETFPSLSSFFLAFVWSFSSRSCTQEEFLVRSFLSIQCAVSFGEGESQFTNTDTCCARWERIIFPPPIVCVVCYWLYCCKHCKKQNRVMLGATRIVSVLIHLIVSF